jgi:hypothetical protein
VRVQILHFFGHKEQVVDLHVLIVGQLQISLLSPRICHGVQLCKVSVEYYTDYYIDRSIVILSKTSVRVDWRGGTSQLTIAIIIVIVSGRWGVDWTRGRRGV